MIRFISLLLIFAGAYQTTYSQQQDWTPSPEDFAATYDDSPDFEAIVLEKKGYLSYEENKLQLLYSAKIHILNEKGRDFGELSWDYLEGEEIEIIGASSFNLTESGEVLPSRLEDQHIFREQIGDHLWNLRFNLPEVRVGTIVYYVYKKTIANPYYFSWKFQDDVPVLESTFELDEYSMFRYSLAFTGAMEDKLESRSKDHYQMKNIPARREEAFVPNGGNYEPQIRIEFAQIKGTGIFEQAAINMGWDNFSYEFRNLAFVRPPEKKLRVFKKKIKELCQGLEDEESKARSIYQFVQSHIQWDEEGDIIPSKTPYEVLESRSGNTADINNLLFQMLRMAKIDVALGLVGTRDFSAMIMKFFISSQFNNLLVVCYINGKEYTLDATDPNRPFGLLALNQLNRIYLVINGEGAYWSNIPIEIPSIQGMRGLFTITTDGHMSGRVAFTHQGYSAVLARTVIKKEGIEEYWNWRMEDDFDQRWVSDVTVTGISDPDSQITVSAMLNIPDFAMNTGDYLYIQPIFTDRILYNPFKDSVRIYPIDFPYPFGSETRISYILPPGFVPEDRPENSKVTLPNGDMSFIYIIGDLDIGVSVMNQLVLRKTFYETDEYDRVKQIYDEMMDRHGHQIVLKKKVDD